MTTLTHDRGKDPQNRQVWISSGAAPVLVAAEGQSLLKNGEVIKEIVDHPASMRNGWLILHVKEGTSDSASRYLGPAKQLVAPAFPGESAAKAEAGAKEFDEPALRGSLPYAAVVKSGDTKQALWIGWDGKFKQVAATGDPAPWDGRLYVRALCGRAG